MLIHFLKNLLANPSDPTPVSTTDPLPVAAVFAAATLEATVVEGYKAPAALAVPEPLAAVPTLVATVTLIAQRAGRGNANAGSVFWGWTVANDTQLKELVPGDQIIISAPPGKLIDLNKLYIDATVLTDGVAWVSQL